MTAVVSEISRRRRYVCSECNRMVLVRRDRNRASAAGNRCARCGRSMIAVRPMISSFARGAGWACVLTFGVILLSRLIHGERSVTVAAALAICGSLACNKLYEGSRLFRMPGPAASISRQTFAEACGAFLVLLFGGGALIR